MNAARRDLACAALAGLLFGSGLILSGMTQPAKVLGFLDLGGRWNPSLALVMAGAIGVALPAFGLLARRGRNLCEGPLHFPPTRPLGPLARLCGGSLLFGAGWGLAGYCPGPALVALADGQAGAAIFCAGMAAGFMLAGRPRG